MSTVKNVSLYIPHIFANYSKEDVGKVFDDLNIGKVKNIDFVSKIGKDEKPFNAAYIHFDYWFDNSAAANFQERVLNPKKEAHLVYEDPWYWIVLENKARKFTPGERKVRIDLGEFPAISTSSLTPLKAKEGNKCPDAPVKMMNRQVEVNYATNLACEFQDEMKEYEEQAQIDAEMDEIEAAMEEEDQNLITIDGRYVGTIEAENMELRNQLAYLHSLLVTEQIKSQTFAEAIKMLQK